MTKNQKLKDFIKKYTGLTVDQFAEDNGYPKQTIYNYTSGKSPVDEEVVSVLYNKYNLNPAWWFADCGSPLRSDTDSPQRVLADLESVAKSLIMAHLETKTPIGDGWDFFRKTITAYKWVRERNESADTTNLREFLRVVRRTA